MKKKKQKRTLPETLTKDKFNTDMKLRRVVCDLAGKGNQDAIDFLWDNFNIHISTKEETKEHIKHCKHCQEQLGLNGGN